MNARRRGHFLREPLFLSLLLEKLRLGDLDGDQVRQKREGAELIVVIANQRIVRVRVDQTDDLLVVEERRHHRGAHVQRDDAVAILEALIRLCIDDQQGRALRQDRFHHRAAQHHSLVDCTLR